MNVQHSPVARNYFELFSLDVGFDLDVNLLKQHFRSLQKKYHPDQFVNACEAEKLTAVKKSSLLNDAFEVLSNPVKRAAYLVELAGVDIQKDRHIDADILAEQIALRETLETFNVLNDETKKEMALEKFKVQIEKQFKHACDVFLTHHQLWLEQQLEANQLKQVLSKILFYDKLLKDVDKALEQFE